MKKGKDVKYAKTIGRSKLTKGKPAELKDFLTDLTYPQPSETMDRERESLGERIRKVRELRRLTLKDVSTRTGIDTDTLKHVESNEMTPPLNQLIRLGRALDMKMGYFISPGVDKFITVVRADQRQPVSRHGEKRSERYGYYYESLAPEKANRLMEPFIVTLVPTDVEEFSLHDGQEFLYVLEGEMKVQVGDHVEFLNPGDAVYYDSNQRHFVRCVGANVTKILAVLYTGSE